MKLAIGTHDKDIRDIEDIIDIQKATGRLDERQLGFSLPQGGMERRGRSARVPGRKDKSRQPEHDPPTQRGRRGPDSTAAQDTDNVEGLFDGVCWPSDSDVTVTQAVPVRRRGCEGDGADPRSMVNLATRFQPPSKQSLLLPLSSWPPPPSPPAATRAARVARFLRLYFCPCSTCLYEMERADHCHSPPSAYCTAPNPCSVRSHP